MMNPIEYLVSSEEMQRYDSNTISKFKVPGLVLMEQAAISCLREIKQISNNKRRVLILAGKGNNGGDAMALARLLSQNYYEVTVCLVSNSADITLGISESAKTQYEILKAMELPIVTKLPADTYDIIIDGIFGVGLSRNIEGNIADIIHKVNSYSGYKIAIDVPSGVDATTGKIYNIAFKADMTFTFSFLKRGLYLLPGAKFTGNIKKCPIGITEDAFFNNPPAMFTLTGSINNYLPKRDSWGHKGTFGKVLLVAGNKEIAGAAILAGKSCLKSGCGMLRILTHKENKSDIISLLPEAMIDCYSNVTEALEQTEKGISWADVIVAGPGIGTNAISEEILKAIICSSKKPLILDADAINLLSNIDTYNILRELQDKEATKRDLILTPHPLELARICHCRMETVQEQGFQLAINLANDLNAIIIKKDANTLITNGTNCCLNLCGNSGMATAGSGDVLSGITAAITALKLPVFESAVISVYLHALAGDYAAKENNEYSMVASDIIDGVTKVLNETKRV